jgi:hypothetical protein
MSTDLYSDVTSPTLQVLESQPDMDINTLVEVSATKIVAVLDHHSPLNTKSQVIKARPPWFNEEVLHVRRELRQF